MDDVLKLHVMVPERYMSQVQMGLDVEVRVEAYPNEVFPGKVARIRVEGDNPRDVDTWNDYQALLEDDR